MPPPFSHYLLSSFWIGFVKIMMQTIIKPEKTRLKDEEIKRIIDVFISVPTIHGTAKKTGHDSKTIKKVLIANGLI